MNGRVKPELSDKYFGIIKKNADKLLALINELLAFREIQHATLKISDVNLFSVVNTVLSRHIWLFEDKEIEVNVSVPEGLILKADQSKLEKIKELSEQFTLDTVLKRKAGKLSGGWQRTS